MLRLVPQRRAQAAVRRASGAESGRCQERNITVEIQKFLRFCDEPAKSSGRVSFLGRPRFFGGGGDRMDAFVRTGSGMRSACFLSR